LPGDFALSLLWYPVAGECELGAGKNPRENKGVCGSLVNGMREAGPSAEPDTAKLMAFPWRPRDCICDSDGLSLNRIRQPLIPIFLDLLIRTRLSDEQTHLYPMEIGKCSKCDNEHELVFSNCVCGICSEAFDRQWEGVSVTHWVLTVIDRADPEAWASGGRSVHVTEWMYDAPLDAIKAVWAGDYDASARDFWRCLTLTPDEFAHLELRTGQWRASRPCLLIRPATSEELSACEESARAWERESRTYEVVEHILGQYGLDYSGGMDDQQVSVEDIERKRRRAAAEIKANLGGLGLLREALEKGWLPNFVSAD